jgi:hypothetical protein
MGYFIKPDPEEIRFIIEIAELASLKTRIEDDKLSPDISLRQAQRKYGAAIVNRWIREHLITLRQDGPNMKYRIDRIQIEVVSKASNRGNYLSTEERSQKSEK